MDSQAMKKGTSWLQWHTAEPEQEGTIKDVWEMQAGCAEIMHLSMDFAFLAWCH